MSVGKVILSKLGSSARRSRQAIEVVRLNWKLTTIKTENATKRLSELLSSKEPKPEGIRLGVRKRGCSGLSYTMDYATEKKPTDEVVEANGSSKTSN